MSTLYPEGPNKELFHCVLNYLNDLQSSNSLNTDQKDSLSASVDCLQNVLGTDTVPNSTLKLEDLYNNYLLNTKNKSNEKKEDIKPKVVKDEEWNKRRNKFLVFIRVLKNKQFFKDYKLHSNEFQKLLSQARLKYNQRFPDLKVGEIDTLDITENDLIEAKKEDKNTNNKNNNSSNNKNTNNINEYNNIDTSRQISENDRIQATKLKNEGNQLLKSKDFEGAIKKYTQAIKLDYKNAVYYSNRAAAFSHLGNFKQAAMDSRKATEINPDYVKAYIRLGVAEYELKNYFASYDAYKEAVDRTPPTDKNWENYMERLKKVEQRLPKKNNDDEINNNNNNNTNSMPDMSNLGNLFGNLGGGQRGQSGQGGLGDILNSPFAQQMMQNMMKDPNMMNNLSNMMNNPNIQNMMKNMGNNNNNTSNSGSGGNEMQKIMQEFMSNPEKAKQVMKEALDDPEILKLKEENEEAKELLDKLQSGDMSIMMQLVNKPNILSAVKSVILKYYKKNQN